VVSPRKHLHAPSIRLDNNPTQLLLAQDNQVPKCLISNQALDTTTSRKVRIRYSQATLCNCIQIVEARP